MPKLWQDILKQVLKHSRSFSQRTRNVVVAKSSKWEEILAKDPSLRVRGCSNGRKRALWRLHAREARENKKKEQWLSPYLKNADEAALLLLMATDSALVSVVHEADAIRSHVKRRTLYSTDVLLAVSFRASGSRAPGR